MNIILASFSAHLIYVIHHFHLFIFFIIQNVKQDEYMKQNGNSLSAFDQKFTVLFFFFRQEGYNAEFG